MRVLVSGYYGAGNLGDEAVLAGLLRGLRAHGHDAIVASLQPARTRREHGVPAAHRLRGLLPALLRCDAVVSGGGGLLQDRTSRRSLSYYLGVIRLARRLGKRVVVFGQSLGPFSEAGADRAARALDGVPLGVRDPASQAWARARGLDATLVADAALGMPPPEAAAAGDTLLLIPRGGYPEVQATLRGIAEAARHAQRPLAVLDLHPDEDAPDADVLADAFGAARWHADDPHAALARMAEAGFVVSGRLHGAILALLAGSGHAGLGYDPKVRGFLEQSGGMCLELPAQGEACARLATARGRADGARRAELLARAEAGAAWLDAQLRDGSAHPAGPRPPHTRRRPSDG